MQASQGKSVLEGLGAPGHQCTWCQGFRGCRLGWPSCGAPVNGHMAQVLIRASGQGIIASSRSSASQGRRSITSGIPRNRSVSMVPRRRSSSLPCYISGLDRGGGGGVPAAARSSLYFSGSCCWAALLALPAPRCMHTWLGGRAASCQLQAGPARKSDNESRHLRASQCL